MPGRKKEPHDFFVIKCPLNKILTGKNGEKDFRTTTIIEDVVMRTHKIVINTYQFIKLYLIHLIDTRQKFPSIDNEFVMTCMRVITLKQKTKESKDKLLKDELTMFYDNLYKPFNPEKVDGYCLDQVLAFEATKIVTSIENMLESEYIKKINQLVNNRFNIRNITKKIKESSLTAQEKKSLIFELRSEARKFKNDLLNVENDSRESDQQYHQEILEFKQCFLPHKSEFDKNFVWYDIKSHTMDYLRHFLILNKWFELNNYKNFNSFPLRSSIRPSYITIDTAALINLFVPAIPRGHKRKPGEVTKTDMNQNVENYKHMWSTFFNTNNRCFQKKDYSFHHQIQTDGVGVSIILSKPKLIKQETEQIKKKEFEYLDNVNVSTDKKIVGIDPGKSDLIYCIDENRTTFRYTANQRRFESGSKKYTFYMNRDKRTQIIDGKTVKQHETELTQFCQKTCDLKKFQEFILNKTKINSKLFSFYQESKTRKFKLNRYFNTQKSESNMVNNFRQKFGPPSQTIIAFGDYTQGQHQMRGLEPTKDIGMRRLFRKHGYPVYLIDEDLTSKLCHRCKCVNENFKYEISHKPKYLGQRRQVHGLIRCTNGNCGIKWNRDYNASLNILEIAKSLVNGRGRPKAFVRNSTGPGRMPGLTVH